MRRASDRTGRDAMIKPIIIDANRTSLTSKLVLVNMVLLTAVVAYHMLVRRFTMTSPKAVYPVDLAPNLKGCVPLVCACAPALVVGVTCRALISWLTMTALTFDRATEMPQHTACSQRWW